jgi:hypothetical protein
LHSIKWSDGKKKGWKPVSSKKKKIQYFFPFRYRKPPGQQRDLDQNRTSPWHTIIKTSTENRESLLKDIREKNNI